MSLPDLMRADAAAISAMDGEDVIYRPAGGDPVTVKAHVQREEPEQNQHRATFRGCILLIPQAAIPRPVQGKDKFDVVMQVGQAAQTVGCGQVISSDHGFWQVRVVA